VTNNYFSPAAGLVTRFRIGQSGKRFQNTDGSFGGVRHSNICDSIAA
jgi:hypothetical protein